MQISTVLADLPEPRRADGSIQICPERAHAFQEGENCWITRTLQWFFSSNPHLKACHRPACPRKSPFKNADNIPLIAMELRVSWLPLLIPKVAVLILFTHQARRNECPQATWLPVCRLPYQNWINFPHILFPDLTNSLNLALNSVHPWVVLLHRPKS